MTSRSRRLVGALVAVAATAVLATSALALEVGDKAPDFSLPSTGGQQPVKLSDLTAKGPVVLYTFIQAFTGV